MSIVKEQARESTALRRLLSELAKTLVDGCAYGRGEIQASGPWIIDHRKCEAVIGAESLVDPIVDMLRRSGCFSAKEQEIAFLEGSLPVWATGFCGVEPEPAWIFVLQKILPGSMLAAVYESPIIQPGPPESLL